MRIATETPVMFYDAAACGAGARDKLPTSQRTTSERGSWRSYRRIAIALLATVSAATLFVGASTVANAAGDEICSFAVFCG